MATAIKFGRRGEEEEMMETSDAREGTSASARISEKIAGLADWRGATLGRVRGLIR